MEKFSVFKAENIKQKKYPHIQSFIKVERTGLRGKKRKSLKKLCLILVVKYDDQKKLQQKLEEIG